MKKQIHIGTSPLTNNIYAGYVLKVERGEKCQTIRAYRKGRA